MNIFGFVHYNLKFFVPYYSEFMAQTNSAYVKQEIEKWISSSKYVYEESTKMYN